MADPTRDAFGRALDRAKESQDIARKVSDEIAAESTRVPPPQPSDTAQP